MRNMEQTPQLGYKSVTGIYLWLIVFGCVAHVGSASWYVGCYMDADDRALPQSINLHASLTIELCVGHCSAAGYKYAGLQYTTQCFCGVNYNKYGEMADTECNKPCAGNKSQVCGGGWRNSVYQTFSDLPEKVSDNKGVDKLTYRGQTTIDMDVNIISYVEDPINTGNVIAATSQQLLEINREGVCSVIAGSKLTPSSCNYTPNNHTFSTITHIHIVDLTTARLVLDRLASEYSLLVVDQVNSCITALDLTDLSVDTVIGECGTNRELSPDIPYQLSDITLSEPAIISVTYFSHCVVLVITCGVGTRLHHVTIFVYSLYILAYQHSSVASLSGYVSEIHQSGLTVRSIGAQANICSYAVLADNLELFFLNDTWHWTNYYFLPVYYRGTQLVALSGRLNSLTVINSRLLAVNLSIASLPHEARNSVTFAQVSASGRAVIVYSESLRTFYYLSERESLSWHTSYILMGHDRLCSQQLYSQYTISVVENCALLCSKAISCIAFSYHPDLHKCLLHEYIPMQMVESAGMSCYHLRTAD